MKYVCLHNPTFKYFVNLSLIPKLFSKIWKVQTTLARDSPDNHMLNPLTLMLLVAIFVITKWHKNAEKWLKPWHMWSHLRVLSKSYLLNKNIIGFKWFSKKSLCLCTLDKSSLSIGRVNTFKNSSTEIVIWKYDTFDNNFKIVNAFTRYLQWSCR